MAQPFQQQPQIKTRMSVLVFLKGSAAPLVLYVDKPLELYEEMLSYLKMPANIKLVEKDTVGPIKKVAFMSNQIAGAALQEEQYYVQ
ncbi:hypothetical protein IJE86_11215 [bacterium]|nr:hypothetical protein [bacterium]